MSEGYKSPSDFVRQVEKSRARSALMEIRYSGHRRTIALSYYIGPCSCGAPEGVLCSEYSVRLAENPS